MINKDSISLFQTIDGKRRLHELNRNVATFSLRVARPLFRGPPRAESTRGAAAAKLATRSISPSRTVAEFSRRNFIDSVREITSTPSTKGGPSRSRSGPWAGGT